MDHNDWSYVALKDTSCPSNIGHAESSLELGCHGDISEISYRPQRTNIPN